MTTPALPPSYAVTLAEAKAAIQAARTRAVLAVNNELIGLYWQLGRLILDRREVEGWGTRVIERLSADLRAAFSEMKGLSTTNLEYMRRFALAWPDQAKVPQLVGKLPWGHVRELLDKLDDPNEREWYAQAAVEHGWSRAVLTNQIMSQLHRRAGAAATNFTASLPAGDSELMQQLTKDPYNLEFLTLAGDAAERDLERALVRQIERFLLELGAGFAFVGRQWHLDLDGDEFFIDLLMFHIPSNRFLCTTRRSCGTNAAAPSSLRSVPQGDPSPGLHSVTVRVERGPGARNAEMHRLGACQARCAIVVRTQPRSPATVVVGRKESPALASV